MGVGFLFTFGKGREGMDIRRLAFPKLADRKLKSIAVVALALGASSAANAQGLSLGEFEYRNSCLQCHGADGKGDGPVAPYLRDKPSDLTALKKNNNGVFQVDEIYKIIDGSSSTQAGVHGRDMPLWGERYRRRLKDDPDNYYSSIDAAEYSGTRILALIEYLSTLQVD